MYVCIKMLVSLLIDESVIKALSGNPDAMDLIAKIERHLNEVQKQLLPYDYMYKYICI